MYLTCIYCKSTQTYCNWRIIGDVFRRNILVGVKVRIYYHLISEVL